MKRLILIFTTLLSFSVMAQTKFPEGYKGAVSLTFDDGMIEHYEYVAPLLDSLGLKATFWIVGRTVDKDPAHYMTSAQIAELAQRGHEMSNHGWAHIHMAKATIDENREEINRCDSLLESITGHKPRTFCYPYCNFDSTVIALASEGRVATRTAQFGLGQAVSKCTSESLDALLDSVADNGLWLVTMTHGIHAGYDHFDDPKVFEDFLRKLAARKDIWVDTFERVGGYVSAQQ